VLIAGAGVAGLEALAALRALSGDRIDITLLAPELKFVNHSMCAAQPFKPRRVRGIRLERIALDHSAHWHRGALARVDHRHRRVVTKAGARLSYDRLLLATGATTEADRPNVLTYRDGRDGPNYRLLLSRLREGQVKSLAFVKPSGGPSWPLPLYDLALMTAADCGAHGRSRIELSFVTPEETPLAVFGRQVGDRVRRLLEENGVTLYSSSYAAVTRHGRLQIVPGDRVIDVDRIVTEPRIVGRRVPGIPFDHDTFIPVDRHGAVRGLEAVYAAGDATNFPVKQGGLAAQQADAAAEAIAASVGVDLDPQPFHPILRGVLLTGGPARYLRADISGAAGDDSAISSEPSWWPPLKLASRYLAPYLSSQTGPALEVHMPAEPLTATREADRPARLFSPAGRLARR
jgi:sulfide:quinone oxidoreductase